MSIRPLWKMMTRRNGSFPTTTHPTAWTSLIMVYLNLMGFICPLRSECQSLPSALQATAFNRFINDDALPIHPARALAQVARNSKHSAWARICVMSWRKSFKWKKNSLLMNRATRLPIKVQGTERYLPPYSIDLHEPLHQEWNISDNPSSQELLYENIGNPCPCRFDLHPLCQTIKGDNKDVHKDRHPHSHMVILHHYPNPTRRYI